MHSQKKLSGTALPGSSGSKDRAADSVTFLLALISPALPASCATSGEPTAVSSTRAVELPGLPGSTLAASME
jgi:hypothetical protein